MPANHDHPTHAFLRELAEEEPFAPFFPRGGRHSPVLAVEAYAELLYCLGATDIAVFLKVYPHVLEDADALVEWTKGTAMLPYLEALRRICTKRLWRAIGPGCGRAFRRSRSSTGSNGFSSRPRDREPVGQSNGGERENAGAERGKMEAGGAFPKDERGNGDVRALSAADGSGNARRTV